VLFVRGVIRVSGHFTPTFARNKKIEIFNPACSSITIGFIMIQDPADFLPPEIAAKIFLESLPVKTTGNLRRNNAIQTLRLVSP